MKKEENWSKKGKTTKKNEHLLKKFLETDCLKSEYLWLWLLHVKSKYLFCQSFLQPICVAFNIFIKSSKQLSTITNHISQYTRNLLKKNLKKRLQWSSTAKSIPLSLNLSTKNLSLFPYNDYDIKMIMKFYRQINTCMSLPCGYVV